MSTIKPSSLPQYYADKINLNQKMNNVDIQKKVEELKSMKKDYVKYKEMGNTATAQKFSRQAQLMGEHITTHPDYVALKNQWQQFKLDKKILKEESETYERTIKEQQEREQKISNLKSQLGFSSESVTSIRHVISSKIQEIKKSCGKHADVAEALFNEAVQNLENCITDNDTKEDMLRNLCKKVSYGLTKTGNLGIKLPGVEKFIVVRQPTIQDFKDTFGIDVSAGYTKGLPAGHPEAEKYKGSVYIDYEKSGLNGEHLYWSDKVVLKAKKDMNMPTPRHIDAMTSCLGGGEGYVIPQLMGRGYAGVFDLAGSPHLVGDRCCIMSSQESASGQVQAGYFLRSGGANRNTIPQFNPRSFIFLEH